jgi:hypothetical protein
LDKNVGKFSPSLPCHLATDIFNNPYFAGFVKKSQTFATATAVKNNELGLFTTGI